MIQDKFFDPSRVDDIYFDRGLYFGDGVYEVLRSYKGKIFALDDHLARFERSMKEISILGLDINKVRERVEGAFAKAAIPDAKIYFHVTRGSGPRGHSWDDEMKPNFFLTVSELDDSSEIKEKGVAVSLYPDLRWKRCDIKSLNLLANVLANQDAVKKGCFEAILVNDDGYITEGSSSAFFSINDGKLITTPLAKNILPSITRKYVLKAAKTIGLEVIEKLLRPEEVKAFEETFIGVTTRDIVPVVEFDGVTIGNGMVGKLTKSFIDTFEIFTS